MRRQESQARAAALSEGTVLNGTYEIVSFVGRGGMGEVYEARHARLAGRYAVKVIFRESSGDSRNLERLRREAEITSSLRHPNIVQVIDFNETPEGMPYLVMEYLDGSPLSDELRRTGPMPIERVATIVEQIADALSAAHERGIVHRDLKPDNVYLLRYKDHERPLVKVMDFGVSKMREGHNLTREKMVIGTPGYMAPEQALGRIAEIDAPADQFALAAIAYELIGGRPAFYAENDSATLYQVVNETPAPLWRFAPKVTPELNRVVMKGLEKRPENRYPSVVAFAKALGAISGGNAADPTPPAVAVTIAGERPSTVTASLAAPAVTEPHKRTAEVEAALPIQPPPGRAVTRETGGDGSRRLKPRRRNAVLLAGIGAAALVVLGAVIASHFGASRRHMLTDLPVVTPAPPPPGLATDRLVKTYLDAAEKFLKDKQYGAARSLLDAAKEANTRDASLQVRMTTLAHAIETDTLVRKAANQLAMGEFSLAFHTAKQALEYTPESDVALKLLLDAKAASVAAAPAEAQLSSRRESRRPSRLSVQSTPPGLVYLDGEPIGRVPIAEYRIRPGPHVVQVRAKGYRPAEQDFDAEAGGTRLVHLVLGPASAEDLAAELDRERSEATKPATHAPVDEPVSGGKAVVAAASSPPRAGGSGPAEAPPAASPKEGASPANPRTTTAGSSSASAPAAAAPAPAAAGIFSKPNKEFPKADLPRVYEARSGDDLDQMLRRIESRLPIAGVSVAYAQGITLPLKSVLQARKDFRILPSAVYYFIVVEAGRSHEKTVAAKNLVAAHDSGGLEKLNQAIVQKGY